MKLCGTDAAVDLKLDIVLQREGNEWVAHCVQLDLLTTDQNEDTAFRRMQTMVVAQVAYACEHDPEFKNLFRPPSAELMRLMSMAKEAGAVNLVLNRMPLRVRRLEAVAA